MVLIRSDLWTDSYQNVAQLVECSPRTGEAGGSSPPILTHAVVSRASAKTEISPQETQFDPGRPHLMGLASGDAVASSAR